MSVSTRRELLKHIQQHYKAANYRDKSKILDELHIPTMFITNSERC